MSKPSWDTAPEWANWLAMDADGTWFWYEQEPQRFGDGWRVVSGDWDIAQPWLYKWKETREQRP